MSGRKQLPPAEKIGPDFVNQTPSDLAAQEAAGKALDMALLDGSGALVQAGRIQVFGFLKNLSHVASIKEFERLRETKAYKGLPYRDKDGDLRHVVDIYEFCEIFLGRSYNSVAEDAKNLHALGDDLYERAVALGLTTRDFRDVRRLPSSDQDLVKEAIQAKSREAVIEIMETVVAKHSKEIAQRDKTISSLQADVEATRKVAAKKDVKLNDLEAKLHKRLNDLPEILQEMRADCTEASGQGISAVQKFTQIRLATMDLLEDKSHDAETVLGAIGATHLQLLWQLQAWLTEEMRIAEQIFGGSRIEIRALTAERGPELDEEQIQNLKNAGADEARRVGARRVVEAYVEHDEKRRAKKEEA